MPSISINRFAILLAGWMVLIWGGSAKATHIMGGEITWRCLDAGPNAGKYVFQMKIYRDCNGVALNANQTLTVYGTGAPVNQIAMSRIGQTDVSPICTPYSGAPIINCATAGGNTPGAVEEHIFQSAAITLAGVPPLTGWVFTWDLCCRNALVANIVNPANYGHTLRAIMYPYVDPATGLPKNTSPCFDSSPKFEESARVVICTGYEYSYSNNASDYDLDSIYYDWAQPLDDGNTWPANPLPFVAPYSYTNPLPSSTPLVLDNVSGRLTLTPNAGGGYVMCIKAETWKCGQKVAEIYRDIQQVFLTNCGNNDPPFFAAVNNTPGAAPIVNLGNNLYSTTVMPGQMVEFML